MSLPVLLVLSLVILVLSLLCVVISVEGSGKSASTARNSKEDQGSRKNDGSQQHQGGGAVGGVETEKPGPLFLLVQLVLLVLACHG